MPKRIGMTAQPALLTGTSSFLGNIPPWKSERERERKCVKLEGLEYSEIIATVQDLKLGLD